MVASSVLCDTSVLKVVDGLTNIMMSLYIIMQAKHFTVLHAGILLVHDHQTTVYKCIQVWRTRYRGSYKTLSVLDSSDRPHPYVPQLVFLSLVPGSDRYFSGAVFCKWVREQICIILLKSEMASLLFLPYPPP